MLLRVRHPGGNPGEPFFKTNEPFHPLSYYPLGGTMMVLFLKVRDGFFFKHPRG